MKIYQLTICCVIFTTNVCSSILSARPELANDRHSVDANNLDCKCENGDCVTDKEGHSLCICRPGFALQDDFTCKPCDCGSLGKCIFIPKLSGSTIDYQKKCVCDTGCAEKDGVCVDCFCGEKSGCEFVFGERRCYCLDGFSEKDGVCTRCDCGLYGKCKYENGDKECECYEKYLELNGICEECDCGNHGNCSFVNGQKTCECEPGQSVNSGKCERCDCGLYGSCEYQNGDKKCECNEGYLELNGMCEGCDCGFYGKCEFQNGDKKCQCNEGYLELNGMCEECDCGDYGRCSFVNDQQTCECEAGYSVNNGKCEQCDCGLKSDKCEFVDGIKQCKCHDRYADRYGTCDECYCGDHSKSCNFNENRKTCSCLEGYVHKGETCEYGCSSQRMCQNGGYCKEGFCFCLNGTRGEFCEIIDECSALCPNQSDIKCAYDSASQKAICSCLDKNLSYDSNTKQCRRACQGDELCKNQGKCTGTSHVKFCDCLEGTTGDFCEEILSCSGVDCGSDAYCVYNSSTKSAGCACKDSKLYYDSTNRRCRKSCKKPSDCLNGGKCFEERFCQCLPGTSGDKCEIIDDCISGRVRCRGLTAYCDYDVKKHRGTCKCLNSKKYYSFLFKKCLRKWFP